MPLDTDGFDSLMTDIAGMASRMDADGAGAPMAKRILEAAAMPIYEQMKANASSDPKIITGVLNRSIQTGKVRKRRGRARGSGDRAPDLWVVLEGTNALRNQDDL